MRSNFVNFIINGDPDRGICINLEHVIYVQPSDQNKHNTSVYMSNGAIINVRKEYADFIKFIK